MINKTTVLHFLRKNKWGVLSTVDKEGKPHAAPIYYVVEDNLDCLFISSEKSQKNINMDFKNEVVLTVTDERKQETVQIRGRVKKDKTLIQSVLEKLADKLNTHSDRLPDLPALKHKGEEKTVVVIRPIQVRMRRYSAEGVEEGVIG